jgi:hypothetical protein
MLTRALLCRKDRVTVQEREAEALKQKELEQEAKRMAEERRKYTLKVVGGDRVEYRVLCYKVIGERAQQLNCFPYPDCRRRDQERARGEQAVSCCPGCAQY